MVFLGRRSSSVVLLGVMAAGACRSAPEPGGDGSNEGDEGNDDDSGGTQGDPGAEAQNTCTGAPWVGPGRWLGHLRGRSRDLGGACGQGGPDAFFRVEVPWRADVRIAAHGDGFVPKVGAIDDGCFDDWSARQLLCTEGVAGWIADLAAGSEFVVSIGIDPVELERATEAGVEDFQFAVDIAMRRVLLNDERCRPESRGRCISGTTCLEGQDGIWTCVPLAGDTCESAASVSLSLGETTVVIDPNQPQTDAHRHGCTGFRMRERVLHVTWPTVPSGASLTIRAERAGVGLAMRASGCGAEREIGCRAPTFIETELEIEQVSSHGDEGIVFVELPGPPDGPLAEESPFPVVFTLASP